MVQAYEKEPFNASTKNHASTADVASTSVSNEQLLQLLAKVDCVLQEQKRNGLFSCSFFSSASLMLSSSENVGCQGTYTVR